MCDLMPHDVAYTFGEVGLVAGQALDWLSENDDSVGKGHMIAPVPSGQRDASVNTEQRPAPPAADACVIVAACPILYDKLEVRDAVAKRLGQIVDRSGYQPLKRVPIDLIHILLDPRRIGGPSGVNRKGIPFPNVQKAMLTPSLV